MKNAILPVLGILLIAASGIVSGVQTGRWTTPAALGNAAAKLDDIPREFAGWTSQPLELSVQQLQAAEATGGIAARYARVDSPPGPRSVEVMLLCGPFGPIAVHPPTVCFKGVGYQQLRDQQRVVVEDAAGRRLGTFWSTDFERTNHGVPQRIRTWWAWSNGGAWMAPESPRFTFAGSQVLHKVYLTEVITSDDGAHTAIPEFAKTFLPLVDRSLFPSSEQHRAAR